MTVVSLIRRCWKIYDKMFSFVKISKVVELWRYGLILG